MPDEWKVKPQKILNFRTYDRYKALSAAECYFSAMDSKEKVLSSSKGRIICGEFEEKETLGCIH